MNKKRLFLVLLVCIILVLAVAVPHGFAATTTNTPPSSGGGGGYEGFGNVTIGVIKAIGELLKEIKFIIELAWYLLTGQLFVLFAKWVGGLADAVLAVTSGTLQTAYIQTAYMSQLRWVVNANTLMWIISVPVLLLALVINVIKLLHGQRQAGELLKQFAIALLVAVMSVQLISLATWVTNTAIEKAVDSGISNFIAVATKNNSDNQVVAGQLTGQQIMILPFTPIGANAASQYPPNPAISNQAPPDGVTPPPQGQPAANTFSAALLGSDGSGLFILIIATIFQLMLNILVLLRFLALALLTIVTPIYVAWATAAKKTEPLAGLSALFVRIFAIQVIFGAGFSLQMSINANTAIYGNQFGGLNPQVINLIILIGMVIVAHAFFLKPTIRAAMSPTTLAGGAVMAKVGDYSERFGRFTQAIGQHIGSPEVQEFGQNAQTFGGKTKALGDKLTNAGQGGRLPGIPGLKETLTPGTYAVPDLYSMGKTINKQSGVVFDNVILNNAIQDRVGLAQDLHAHLIQDGYVTQTGKRVTLSPDDVTITNSGVSINRQAMNDNVKRGIDAFLGGKKQYWQDGGGYRIMIDGQPVRVESPPSDGINFGNWGGKGAPDRQVKSDNQGKPQKYEDFLEKRLKNLFKGK